MSFQYGKDKFKKNGKRQWIREDGRTGIRPLIIFVFLIAPILAIVIEVLIK